MRRPRHDMHVALDEYVTRLHATEANLEDLVGEASEHAAALGPLLKIADQTYRELRPGIPNESFVLNVERRLLNQLRQRTVQTPPRRAQPRNLLQPRGLRRAAWALGLLLITVLLVGSVGLVQASAATLPGDGLYPLKRGIEETRLVFTFASEADARLLGEFSEERIRELEGLLDAGRAQDLEAAVEGYLAMLERYCQLADQVASESGFSESQHAQDKVAHNVEVLQSLLTRLPAQAQAALQQAIDHSLDHQHDMETRQSDRDQQQAQQIAKKYGPSVADALEIYNGICDHRWNCVRAYFREGEPEGATPLP